MGKQRGIWKGKSTCTSTTIDPFLRRGPWGRVGFSELSQSVSLHIQSTVRGRASDNSIRNGGVRTSKLLSTKVMRTLAKTVKTSCFRTLEINQRFEAIWGALIQERHQNFGMNTKLCGILTSPVHISPHPQTCSSLETNSLPSQ